MIEPFRQLIRYREAIRMLVARDLTVRYSNSVLGVLWSLLNPLLMMLVFTLVFTFLMPSQIEKYPVYILAGLLPWTFLTGSIASATASIVHNGPLISRVYFPRDILPIAAILAHLVNFLLALALLFTIMFVYGVSLEASLAFLPVLILIQCLFSLGVGLFLAALNVHFRDTQATVEVLTLAWFFATPIIYPIDLIRNAELRWVVQVLNPMASLIVHYRAILYAGRWPDFSIVLITTVEAVLVLALGYWFFHKASPSFVEEL
jgi:ABC-type polysaccharide/polyol phosphate export permease